MAEDWRSIGDLARDTGVKVPTIRFYEQIGLLPEARRTQGAWRVYDEAAFSRLRFVKHARELGFSLTDLRALLALADAPDQPCGHADEIARTQLAAVERKMAQLKRLKRELQQMVNVCSGAAAGECRVVEALTDGARAKPTPPRHERKRAKLTDAAPA